MGFVFDAEEHEYYLDGDVVPSISRILEPIKRMVYDDIPPYIMQIAADRGTAVHLATEMFDRGKDYHIDIEHSGYMDAYLKFASEHEYNWQVIEQPLPSRLLQFAGTPDRYGLLDDSRAVMDIKTTSQLHHHLVIPQLAAQEILIRENVDGITADTEIDRYILQLKSDGNYRLEKYDNGRDVFLSLLRIYDFMEGR